MTIVIDVMIFAGAALMVWNILRYNKYMKSTMEYGDWEGNKATLIVPLILLIMFLLGYLIVGLTGKPDIIMAGILFGGSIFVAIIVRTLERVTEHLLRWRAQDRNAPETERRRSICSRRASRDITTRYSWT